jgi:hypothetical protein
MKILVTGLSMAYLSGQPMYDYELCRELKKQGHEVTMMSEWEIPLGQRPDNEGHKLRENLLAEGIICINWDGQKASGYDLILASEPQSEILLQTSGNTPIFNIVHSEYECESPMRDQSKVLMYICIRPSIAAHIITQHGIDPKKVKVIYNGVDRVRFSRLKRKPRDLFWNKVVVPCTLDKLREKFLNHLIDNAIAENRIYIYGMDCGADLHESEFVKIYKDMQ